MECKCTRTGGRLNALHKITGKKGKWPMNFCESALKYLGCKIFLHFLPVEVLIVAVTLNF